MQKLPKKTQFILVLITVLLFSFLTGCVRLPKGDADMMLGTVVTITIHDMEGSRSNTRVLTILDSAFYEIKRIERLAHKNELYYLNCEAGTNEGVFIGDELTDLIEESYFISNETGGAFSPELGPLIDLWGIDTDSARVPASWEIETTLERIDSTTFTMLDSGYALLSPYGAKLDLGAVAKGYAVDRAVHVLRRMGVTAGIVEAGGDLRCFGTKPDGKPWRLGVRHPRNHDQIYTYLEIDSGAVATSGDYERFFTYEGVNYHHLFDPWTGYPARYAISATVIAEDCMHADAYATAVFVLGPKEGLDLAWELEFGAQVLSERNNKIFEDSNKWFDRRKAEY